MPRKTLTATAIVAITVLWLTGCASVPPHRVAVDRMGYGEVIADSWKRQTLLNVVRLRYADAPVFLDVASVINSYSVAGKTSASAQLPEGIAPNVFSLGAEGSWSNTPTVTYQPLLGDRFTRSMLQPVPPASVFQLIQSGWPVDLVLRSVVGSINGLRNSRYGVMADPGFDALVEAMARIQRAGNMGIRVDSRKDRGSVVVVLRRTEADASTTRDVRVVSDLLGLTPDSAEFDVTYGLASRGDGEVALLTRSMLELLLELGFGVDLPAAHVAAGRVTPGLLKASDAPRAASIVRIRSGTEMPADSYAAVPYKGHWYWIDDNDIASKRMFTFLLILSSLAETGQGLAAPVVTVPSR
ncbi:MAG: hypothetical protein NTW37_18590 [Proteobacteria bacterium]|nr:hypothetical protein [Pseudomonadota bacterium]